MSSSTEPRLTLRSALALALAGCVWAAPAAQACDSASCSLLTRGESGLLPKKRFRLDFSFGRSDQSVLLRGSQEVDEVFRPRVFLERGTVIPGFHRDIDGYDQTVQADGTYGLSARVNLVASVPLAVWHSHEVAHGSIAQEYGTVGIGDTLVGVRWALRPRALVGGFSVKLPTGRYDIGGEFRGGIQDPTLQPGTGATDFVGSLQYSWKIPWRMGAAVAASYQVTTTNDLEYRFGNQLIATAGVSRPISARLAASLQAKLFHQDRNLYRGIGVPSTGSTMVYVTPGLRFSTPGRVSLYAFLLLIPYRHVNEAQLAPRAAVLTGLSKVF
jgi:outer membrane putative beta-barrel porin/alpha-amylase